MEIIPPFLANIGNPADTDGREGPVDPLAALEKSTDAQNYVNQVQKPRLEALQSVSDHYGSDPYSLSTKVRKRFREEKKIEQEKAAADDQLKNRYGLPQTLALAEESDATKAEAKEIWLKGRKDLESRHKKKATASTVGSSKSSPLSSLRAQILQNTARRRLGASKDRGGAPR